MLALAEARSGHGGYRWIERGDSVSPGQLIALRDLLWHAAGPVREASSLRDAWRACAVAADNGWQMPLAAALLRAARLRERSLGAHCRHDRACPA